MVGYSKIPSKTITVSFYLVWLGLVSFYLNPKTSFKADIDHYLFSSIISQLLKPISVNYCFLNNASIIFNWIIIMAYMVILFLTQWLFFIIWYHAEYTCKTAMHFHQKLINLKLLQKSLNSPEMSPLSWYRRSATRPIR